jgi:hypothetical protein
MSAALRRSFQVLPPTHFVRVTVLDPMQTEVLTRCVGRFLRRLRRRDCEYLAVNEWVAGERHHHLLVRTECELTPRALAELWQASCAGARVTSYCHPVRTPEGAARYVVKDVRDWTKKEVPPAWFRGKLFTSSKRFLAQPLKVLMRAVVSGWQAKTRKSAAHKATAE